MLWPAVTLWCVAWLQCGQLPRYLTHMHARHTQVKDVADSSKVNKAIVDAHPEFEQPAGGGAGAGELVCAQFDVAGVADKRQGYVEVLIPRTSLQLLQISSAYFQNLRDGSRDTAVVGAPKRQNRLFKTLEAAFALVNFFAIRNADLAFAHAVPADDIAEEFPRAFPLWACERNSGNNERPEDRTETSFIDSTQVVQGALSDLPKTMVYGDSTRRGRSTGA